MVIGYIIFLGKAMKRSSLTAKNASLDRLFQRRVIEQVKHWENWYMLYLPKTKVLLLSWSAYQVIRVGFAGFEGVCNKEDDRCYIIFFGI